MPQFDIVTYASQLFWLVIVFGFLYYFIAQFVSPKAEQIFKNRQDSIENDISEAEDIADKTKKLKEYYLLEVKATMEAADNVKNKALRDLEAFFVQKKDNLLKEIELQAQDANNEIELAIKSYNLDEPTACIKLAKVIVEKITNKKLNLELLEDCYKKVK